MAVDPQDERRTAGATSAQNGSPRHTVADRVLKAGIERALVVFDAAEASGALTFDWFEHAATRCAQDGIPIETVHAVVTDSVTAALGRLSSATDVVDGGREVGLEQIAPSTVLDELIAVVSRAYA